MMTILNFGSNIMFNSAAPPAANERKDTCIYLS